MELVKLKQGVKYTLYVGLNDKDLKRQIIPTSECQMIVNNTIYALTDGGTVYPAYGVYKHDNGVKVLENTIKIELTDVNDTTVSNVIDTLKKALNQESIMCEKRVIEYEFI